MNITRSLHHAQSEVLPTILADATIPDLQELFSRYFKLTTYQNHEEFYNKQKIGDALICRSTLKITQDLLIDSHFQFVATASSGVDHIAADYLANHCIPLFDAKGANANSVADYVASTLISLEKHHGLVPTTAGIIGMGEVGSRVYDRLAHQGLTMHCYDPLKRMRHPKHRYTNDLNDLQACDLICIHANWHKNPPFPSHLMINNDFLNQLKPGTIIINASRGWIVDEAALLKLKTLYYCTDVYANEPNIDSDLIEYATICTPHIAGHSIEGKKNATRILSQKIHAHYHLPTPPAQSYPCLGPLELYDPMTDTLVLKSAPDKKTAFLTQRSNHQFRHDYILYDLHHLPKSMQYLLGKYF